MTGWPYFDRCCRLETNNGNDYIFFNDTNMKKTLEAYIGRKLSILYDGEIVYSKELTENMIFEDYALRLESGEIEELGEWFTWKR